MLLKKWKLFRSYDWSDFIDIWYTWCSYFRLIAAKKSKLRLSDRKSQELGNACQNQMTGSGQM